MDIWVVSDTCPSIGIILLPINDFELLVMGWSVSFLDHGTITWVEITRKKIPCYMCDSACRWFIVKKS